WRERGEFESPVRIEVHQLKPAGVERRRLAYRLHRTEPAFAAIGLVEPRAALRCQNARDSLAVEIDPLILPGGESDGQILEALLREIANWPHSRRRVIERALRVMQIQRRQRFFSIPSVAKRPVARLRDPRQPRDVRLFVICEMERP